MQEKDKAVIGSSTASMPRPPSVVLAARPLAMALALTTAASAALAAADGAAPAAVEEKVVLGPAPTDFGLKYEYYNDAQLVREYIHVFLVADPSSVFLLR
jgi:hypothetical protein